MVQSKANRWIHILLPALLAALRALGDAPAHSLTALAQRLDAPEVAAATIVAPLEEALMPVATGPAAAPVSPLLPMMGYVRDTCSCCALHEPVHVKYQVMVS